MNHAPLISAMIEYETGCAQRIQHFMKVYGFAKTIGVMERLDCAALDTLEAAAIVHDIGIRPSLEKYGSDAGPYQEKEGPAPARGMLRELGYPEETVDRVCWLVAHHHTYQPVGGMDHQILIEADFLVNLFENNSPPEKIRSVYENIFRTETGRRFCRDTFHQAF